MTIWKAYHYTSSSEKFFEKKPSRKDIIKAFGNNYEDGDFIELSKVKIIKNSNVTNR